MENISEFGERLERLLKDCKMTKKGLADGMGVSPSTVTQYFEADAPSIETIRRICEACGVKAWQFIAQIETGILEAVRKLPEARQRALLELIK